MNKPGGNARSLSRTPPSVNGLVYGVTSRPGATFAAAAAYKDSMKALILFVSWLVLLVVSWPLALLALFLAPIIWIISLPFRLIGITFGAVFSLLKAILMLPARIIGYRRRPTPNST